MKARRAKMKLDGMDWQKVKARQYKVKPNKQCKTGPDETEKAKTGDDKIRQAECNTCATLGMSNLPDNYGHDRARQARP